MLGAGEYILNFLTLVENCELLKISTQWRIQGPPPSYLRVWMTVPPSYLKVWIHHCYDKSAIDAGCSSAMIVN